VLPRPGGNANLGWFNSASYADSDTGRILYLGWRRKAIPFAAARGTTGSALLMPPAICPSDAGKPFNTRRATSPTRRSRSVLAAGD